MSGIAPTPTLTTYQDHTLLDASDLNGLSNHIGQIYNNTMGGFKNKKPICQALTTTTHSVLNNTGSLEPFDTWNINTDGMWVSTSPDRFTINTAGWYRINFQVHWDTNTTAQRVCAILVNGTNIATNAVASDSRTVLQVANTEGTTVFCEAVTHLAAGSVIYPYVSQNSGATRTTTTTYSGTFFTLEWIAPY